MKKFYRVMSVILIMTMFATLCGCHNEKKKEDETKLASDSPTEITVNLHYTRDNGDYDGWNVWFWTTGDGASYNFTEEDGGVVTTGVFPAGTTKIGFIVRLNDWEQKDVSDDRFIDTSSILAGTVDVYVKSGEAEFETVFGDDCITGTGVSIASISDDYSSVIVFYTAEWDESLTAKFYDRNDEELNVASVKRDEKNPKKVVYALDKPVDEFGSYYMVLNTGLKYDISVPDAYNTEAFNDKFNYDGDDLGASWSDKETVFKVWAPTATSAKVNLYTSGDSSKSDLIKSVDMKNTDKGVWEATVTGNQNGVYYTYTVNVEGKDVEACDPYARAVGVNGNRAMVIDLTSTNPDGWDKDTNPFTSKNCTDAIIYELQIRDLSSDKSSGIKNVGKYLEFTESGTTNATGQATGIDHIKDLGITHIQLNPVYDYATVDETKLDTEKQYNWGYDPKNYNVPEGSYSTDPYNGEVRINEFKQMVQSLHEDGISVVMDVVYNHTYNTDYCFNKLVPGYFYRPNSNGSGCGNDVATERAMVRKFIVDSVVYWAKEYHVNGFRFDLVGLIDAETMKEVRAALDEIDPSIILYGEGWSMTTTPTIAGTTLATQKNVDKLNNFSMFNDTIRDSIKGSVFNSTEKGYVNGDISRTTLISQCLRGSVSWCSKASQLINYSSCHDNMTLWDEINSSNPDDSQEDKIKQNLLAAAIVYTAQGVPFILAGEEMLRTKVNDDGTFNSNSYNAPDTVNSIKWDTLADPDYQRVNEYYKGLIEFRKAHTTLRTMQFSSRYYTEITGLPDGVIAYEINPGDGEVSDEIITIYNPLKEDVKVTLPEGNWTICVQNDKAGTKSLGTAAGEITVNGISCTVLVKGSLE